MTRSELLEMAKKLQAEAESMPQDTQESATTTEASEVETGEGEEETRELNANGELEEQPQIEPQTNGVITDVVPGVDTQFEESTVAEETVGVEQVLQANLDKRFATMLKSITDMKIEMDKMKVVLSEIMTRIELVQEVTDKVTTVDHDTLLSESIKLMI